MEEEQQKAVYGIIGNPVKHSLSPLMHNAAFQALEVAAEYRLFPLKEEELGGFFVQLHEKDSPVFGLNVTVPYKEAVLSYLDYLHPLAQQIKAVNTIVISNERQISGFNTDGPGFLAHLAELNFDVKDKRIALLGAGGTARAILGVLCLLPERPASIKIYNRTKEKADMLIRDLGERLDVSIAESVYTIDDLDVENSDLLVNTTSVGLNEDDPCLIDESLLHSRLLVYDVIYGKETPLLRLARSRNARTANGLGLLYYQGILAFQHWANAELDEETKLIMRRALEEGVHHGGI